MRSKLFSIVGVDAFKDVAEKLFNSPEVLVHREVFENDSKIVIFEIDKIKDFLKDDKGLTEILKLLDDKHECKCCGTHSNYFFQDYRGSWCTSRYNSCPVCYCLNDKEYFRIMDMQTVELDYADIGFTTELED